MLKIYQLSDGEQWNTVVRSFEKYDVYYLKEYVEAFSIRGDGEPLLFCYEDEDLRAIHVVMKRDIAADERFKDKIQADTFYDVVTPYGYGGWLFQGLGLAEKAYEAYILWCKQNNIISEFVRFSLFSNSRESYYGDVIPRMNNVVCDLNCSMNDMLMRFEHKVRKNYKKAQRAGLQIEIDTVGDKLNDFLDIYYSTMDRNNAEKGYYFTETFFKTINKMRGNFTYFHVLYEGKIIASELVIIGSENMYSYLGGTYNEYFDMRPNDFLKCEIIKWGIEQGYRRFVLGGGYGSDDGIFRYKKGFAPEGIVQFYTGQMIFSETEYKKLVNVREENLNPNFFPQYRA